MSEAQGAIFFEIPRIPPHNALDISGCVVTQEMSPSNTKYLDQKFDTITE